MKKWKMKNGIFNRDARTIPGMHSKIGQRNTGQGNKLNEGSSGERARAHSVAVGGPSLQSTGSSWRLAELLAASVVRWGKRIIIELLALEHLLHLFLSQRLVLDQRLGQDFQLVALLG